MTVVRPVSGKLAAGKLQAGGEQIQLAGQVLNHAARGDRAGPPGQERDSNAPFPRRVLSLSKQTR